MSRRNLFKEKENFLLQFAEDNSTIAADYVAERNFFPFTM
jgi:hypothetical protein